MSRETIQWLNNRTLVGFTSKRGNAWHYRLDEQGDESNHYPDAIPVEDVERRLFNWNALEAPVSGIVHDDEGNELFTITDPSRKVIMRPPGALGPDDRGGVLGTFKAGYAMHQYREWLLDTVGMILDDELSIGSAGLLREGANAWVSVEVPDSVTTPSGVEFRPNLLACTSFDGTLATTFKKVATLVVCDNTRDMALAEQGQQHKIRHSKYSHARLHDMRNALEIVHATADTFSAEVERMTNVQVSEGDWAAFLDTLIPLRDEAGDEKEGRALTMAQSRREALETLYYNDPRVEPWHGTAFGALQAVNTAWHHVRGAKKGAERGEANTLAALKGETGKNDAEALAALTAIVPALATF